ncbi:MAG: alanine--glyoxylate aminotransferase family protein [Nitrososphaerales archaeon]|nr:alanine--glyoxylate aminotransferase family protein [Nitrososphaerales archaeon]
MGEKLLLIPGPTNLSKRVREVMAGPQLAHVGSEFYGTFKDILQLSRYALKNEKGFQFVFTGTGTTGMESSVVSLVSHGDRTLTLETGYFGKRMLLLNQIHRAKADSIAYPDGRHADPEDLRKKLKKTKYKVVFITHVDTATSIVNPIRELVAECAKAGVISVVDSVCGVGGEELDFDKLGADIVFTASQKALAGAPGAVILAVSNEALRYMEGRKEPIESYYMSLLRWKPIMDDPRMYLATPAIQVLLALREALREVKEESIEARWIRHHKLGESTRQKVSEMGLRFVADEGFRADTVTSFWVEEGKAGGIQKTLNEKYDIMVSRGIYEARDKMIRIGHFGILTVDQLRQALAALDSVLVESGVAGRSNVQLAKRK